MSKERSQEHAQEEGEEERPDRRGARQSTFNNTIITITDLEAGWSPGRAPARWASRARARHAVRGQVAGEDTARKAKEHGVRRVEVYVKVRLGARRHPLAPGGGSADQHHQGRHPHPAQRLPPPSAGRVAPRTRGRSNRERD